MKAGCVLCSFQEACSETAIFVYAATPTLRQIVASHLHDLEAPFQLQNGLFRLTVNRDVAIDGLRSRLSEAERADIRVSRESGAALLAASTLEAYGRRLDTEWFEEALRKNAFTTFFQPIYDTRTASVFGHECLIRLFSDREHNGSEIIQAAMARGSVHLFDSYARRLSIRKAAQQFTSGIKVFVNFMPSSIYDPAFCMASTQEEMKKTALQPEDIVFEVVESDEVRDVKHLVKICDYYRKVGFGFALDDVGTGSNSLQMVCELKPDYIKLDKSLISGVPEPMYCAAIEKLSEFAERFGLHVIAEGVETAETAEMLRGMGIHLMQGYYFGKPSSQMNSTSGDLTQISSHLGDAVKPEGALIEVVAPSEKSLT